MQKRHIWRPCSLAAAICLMAGGALVSQGRAQGADEANGGVLLSFGLTATIRADDNSNLGFGAAAKSGLFQNTRLTFGASFETAATLFRLNANAGVQLSKLSGESLDTAFDDPRVSLRYERTGADSSLTLTANYRRSDLEFFEPLADPDPDQPADPDDPGIDDIDLIAATGTRLTYGAALVYEIGREGPFGATFDLRRQTRDYSATTNTSLFDTETTTLATALRFDLSPVTSVRLRLSHRGFIADDTEQTDRVTRSYTLSLTQDLNPTLVFDASLGITQIETESGVGVLRNVSTTDGTTFSLGVTQDRTDGSIRLSYSRSVGVSGDRDTLQISRDLELARGTLNASLGATRIASGKVQTTARLAYSQDLSHGSFSASLERNVSTNSLEEDVLSTRVAVNYRVELSTLSSLSLGVNYALTEDAGAGGTVSRDRANLQASYAYALTEKVDLNVGYQHRLRSEGGETATSNSIFLTLSHKFDLRP
jgi:hypothetical protein